MGDPIKTDLEFNEIVELGKSHHGEARAWGHCAGSVHEGGDNAAGAAAWEVMPMRGLCDKCSICEVCNLR